MQKVAVLGLGYVGLPLFCAIKKHTALDVHGFDIDIPKITEIQSGTYQSEDEYVQAAIDAGDLSISADPDILRDTDVFFVCVPTPVRDDFSPDLSPLLSAIDLIAPYLRKGGLVIIESTVNPGVCDEIVIPRIQERTGLTAKQDFDLAHCPERINPGDRQWNILNIPRNIGATSAVACRRAADMYRSFLQAPIHEMANLKEAEATKVIENTFRDINIAYVNELAKSFDAMNIDLVSVLSGAASKPFGFLPHFPGCGVGGHCIPVDPYYLIDRAMKSGFDHKFLRHAREINNSMPAYTVEILVDALNDCERSIKGASVGILGLAYKGNVKDMRESPAHKIIALLKAKGADILTFDPYFPDESVCKSLTELLRESEAVVIATEHDEFRALSPEDFLRYNVRIVVDGKNIYDKASFEPSSLIYRGIGRGQNMPT